MSVHIYWPHLYSQLFEEGWPSLRSTKDFIFNAAELPVTQPKGTLYVIYDSLSPQTTDSSGKNLIPDDAGYAICFESPEVIVLK